MARTVLLACGWPGEGDADMFNPQTARAFGLNIPKWLVHRADRVVG
jgi:hypothetical protein